jgi:hypothetical protein
MLLAQFALTLVVIPPWQNPDEPQHVMFASVLAKHGTAMLPDAFDDQIEGDIVASMARHRWWQLYGRPVPSPMPPTFKGVESVQMSSIQGPAAYYVGAASLLNRLRIDDVTSRLYVLRLVSAALGLAALWSMWAGTRLLIDTTAASVVVLLAALHPQFAIVSTTASPDAVVNCAGAVMWWQTGRIWARRRPGISFVVLIAAALIGAAVARLGLPLLAVALGVCLWSVMFRLPIRDLLRRVNLAAVGTLAVVAVGAAWSFREEVRRILFYGAAPVWQALLSDAPRRVDFWRWAEALYASSWLTAGWMRFPAPDAVLAVVGGVTASAIAGLLIAGVRDRALRQRIALALLFIVVPSAAIVVVFYLNGIGAQGRYLFSALAAILSLTWLGVSRLVPPAAERSVSVILVTVAYLLNVLSWRAVLLHLR